MNMQDLEITNTALYRSLIKQTKKSLISVFTHSITEEEAKNTAELRFKNCEINNFNFLRYYPNLTDLTIDHVNGIKDIKGIGYLTNLKNLSIYETYINDLTPLSNCRELEYLDYMNEKEPNKSGAPELGFIKNLPNLYQLDLSGQNIRNIDFLMNLPNITQLVLTDNPLSSIKGIETLHNLEYLELDNCMLSSLDGIEQLKCLKNLYAQNNKLNSEQILAYKRQFSYIEKIGL